MSEAKSGGRSSAARRHRSLTSEEADLWSVVIRTVRPLRPAVSPQKRLAAAAAEAKTAEAKTAGAKTAGAKAAGAKAAALRTAANTAAKPSSAKIAAAKTAAAKTAAAIPAVRARLPAPPGPIMRREKRELARGQAAIDARIDLHGMTQSQAYAALCSLLQRAQASGAKFVLVITGKGSGAFGGVLRRQVPQWLALPEFRPFVAGYDVAHTGHGGEGALYVRLRRHREGRGRSPGAT